MVKAVLLAIEAIKETISDGNKTAFERELMSFGEEKVMNYAIKVASEVETVLYKKLFKKIYQQLFRWII